MPTVCKTHWGDPTDAPGVNLQNHTQNGHPLKTNNDEVYGFSTGHPEIALVRVGWLKNPATMPPGSSRSSPRATSRLTLNPAFLRTIRSPPPPIHALYWRPILAIRLLLNSSRTSRRSPPTIPTEGAPLHLTAEQSHHPDEHRELRRRAYRVELKASAVPPISTVTVDGKMEFISSSSKASVASNSDQSQLTITD